MKNQILLTFMLAAATPPQAADWHVAPDGDDNNAGTEAAPFATIQHAINQAAAGDRVFLAEGEYSQAVKINKPNLTLRALPGAHAHIHQPIDDEDVEATVWIQPDGAGTHLFGLEISGGYNYTLKIDSIWADDGVTLPPEEREAATGVVVEKSR